MNSMRKMFRFKYEPCNGTCYAWCDTLIRRLRELPDSNREALVALMVEAHDKLCDNPEYSFGVDTNNEQNVFVAHFRTPDKTDLYTSVNFKEAVAAVCKAVLETDIPQISGACEFGDNGAENLGREILKFCTDEAFFELEARHCECKSHV
jgi:hypothetical protein